MTTPTVRCSCGLLPCICVLHTQETRRGESRLQSLVAANATTQCMSCMFLPCICPADENDEDDVFAEDEVTSIEATSPLGSDRSLVDGAESRGAEVNDDDEDFDSIGRVRLPSLPHDSRIDPGDVWIAPEIKRHLRPHQIEGVRFLYHSTVENQGCILADYMGLGKTLQVITAIYAFMTDRLLECEGAGKTCSRASDLDSPPTTVVLSPAICIPNWENEFKKWLSPDSRARCPVFTFDSTASKGSIGSRIRLLQKWKREGGVLLMGYEMFRSLLNPTVTASLDRDSTIQICSRVSSSTMEITNAITTKAQKSSREFFRLLCQPGADLVVLDEGHRMKDPTSLLCQSVGKIASKRRLVLTGYPVQNSLSEYWCMVNFARENFLGTYEEFRSKYERPILDGNLERSKELTVKLKNMVLRRGKILLDQQLPPKREWILYCKLSPLQHRLYCDFLEFYGESSSGRATADLLTAYAVLLQVMNHPDIIYSKLQPGANEPDEEDIDASVGSATGDEDCGWGWESEEKIIERQQQVAEQLRKRRQKTLNQQKTYEWASRSMLGLGESTPSRRRKLPRSSTHDFVSEQKMNYSTMVLGHSGKMVVLMSIIKESFAVGDKVVVFSQSVPTLKIIGDFLRASAFNPDSDLTSGSTESLSHTPATKRKMLKSVPKRDPAGLFRKRSQTAVPSSTPPEKKSTPEWFLQIDGSTTGAKRMEYIQTFSSSTSGVKLLLVSTRAGAEGINLHAANRLVLFDVSWNPSNDHQSMCRSHRIGQSKTVDVYRLVSTGTMERMIYEQQMKKVDLSTSVVDDDLARLSSASSSASTRTPAPFSGFLRPPAAPDIEGVGAELDQSMTAVDDVLTKTLQHVGNWVVDARPAHELEDEDTGPSAKAGM